jgi:hypothetical protein
MAKAVFVFLFLTFLSSQVLSFTCLHYQTAHRNIMPVGPRLHRQDFSRIDAARRPACFGSGNIADFRQRKAISRASKCRRLVLSAEMSKDETKSEQLDQVFQDVSGSMESQERIDLAVSAQQRFQGLEDSENDLKKKSVTQDVLKLSLGSLGIALLIVGSMSPGLPLALPLVLVFVIGYLAIIYESTFDINKSASALLMAVVSWCLVGHAGNLGIEQVLGEMDKSLASVSQIFLFLMSAMAVVETIDAHDGFSFITNKIRTTDKRTLLVIISTVTFFLSAVLDNLTTTIVMCSLLSRLISDEDRETRKVSSPITGLEASKEELNAVRQVMGGMAVIAANAGGAWSPIGDVTTTMLWINGQVTTLPLVEHHTV